MRIQKVLAARPSFTHFGVGVFIPHRSLKILKMETPVLSKKQIKSTLSAKKNRPKETLKNVLAIPYNNYYWPEISFEDEVELQAVLKANLPKLVNKKVNIPWKELKDLPKAERKAYQMEYAEKMSGPQPSKENRLGIHVGVNEVSKLLENNSARAVLVSSTVKPKQLVQHVLDQAVLHKIPVLCVSNLKPIMKSATGIPTIAFAINKDITDDSKLNLIIEKIENVFKNLPVPENHINYNRSIDSFETENPDEKKESTKKKLVKVDEAEVRKGVYLKRHSEKSRAFAPKIEKTQHKVFKMEIDESGFVPLTEEPQLEFEVKKSETNIKGKHHYKSLVVKRLKGDKDRSQKKIENLKRKRKHENDV